MPNAGAAASSADVPPPQADAASSSPASRPSPTDRRIALALFALSFLALALTQRDVGFVRDEGMYFSAARSYGAWFQLLARNPAQAFTDSAIVASFDNNHEHPVLMKSLFALSRLLFHGGLGMSESLSLRLPAFAIAALIPALIFLFGAALFGRRAALFAAAAFLLVPRHFFNAQLACFDMPVAAMWLLTVYLFWRAQEEARFWAWCGVAFGLALCTKHNALFLPFVLAPFALYRAYRAAKASSPKARFWTRWVVVFAANIAALYGVLLATLESEGPGRFQARFILLSPHTMLFVLLVGGGAAMLWQLRKESEAAFRPLATLAAMAVLGPALFYLHWPYLWHHPVDRTAWYLAFHATHNHYAWFYLGTLLREPPFPLTYVIVKTALTVPTSLFVPMAVGLLSLAGRCVATLVKTARAAVRPVTFAELLVGANAVASILIISHPQVPHFGGVKHWLPSMPFLALLAGVSVSRAVDWLTEQARGRLSSPRAKAAAFAAVSALLFIPALIASVRIHPYGTSYYSELAGGVPGAATLGMQRQFWSNNVTGVLPWINAHAPQGARVWLHEVHPMAAYDYRTNGLLRADLTPVWSAAEADIAAYQYHQEFREQEFSIWEAFGTRTPVTGLYVDETPQVVVYQRR